MVRVLFNAALDTGARDPLRNWGCLVLDDEESTEEDDGADRSDD